MSEKKAKPAWFWVLVGVGICFVIGLGGCLATCGFLATATAVGVAEAEKKKEAVKADGSFITMEKFNQLEDGISYEDAVKILGKEGQETSRSTVMGHSAVMYTWTNPGIGGGNMNAMFQNDSLMSKAQFGLE